MSLIDTQAVINLIADIQYDDRYINNNEVFVALETVRDCVFNLPTAYNVDKVIEEIDKHSIDNTDWSYSTNPELASYYLIRTKDAVDIIKGVK